MQSQWGCERRIYHEVFETDDLCPIFDDGHDFQRRVKATVACTPHDRSTLLQPWELPITVSHVRAQPRDSHTFGATDGVYKFDWMTTFRTIIMFVDVP